MANYIAKSPLKNHIERKAEGGGRMNKMFSDRTPKVTDSEIRSLVLKYPLGEKKEPPISQNENSENILY